MVVVLAGGVGAARFLRGLTAVVPPEDITVVVNVGDDIELHGLRICPDLDSITYWLAGLVHPEQQWGRDDERFTVRDELVRLGHAPWFTLGDRDLALHLHRTAQLRAGVPLSTVTADVAARHGLTLRLLPVTDDRIETRIHTADRRDLHFQEWWVGERAGPDVDRVEFRGPDAAPPAPGVVEEFAFALRVKAHDALTRLQRRELEPAGFDLAQLAAASEGYSGAEIEQAVVSALYAGQAQQQAVDQSLVLRALQGTAPLSVVMAERLAALRAWADGRTVNAG